MIDAWQKPLDRIRLSLQRRRPICHPAIEGAAAVPRPAATSSIATLFTSHILQDGEIVQLILKPSAWFMLISGARSYAVGGIVICTAILLLDRPRYQVVVNVTVLLMFLRLMWTILVWMGQVYVLTDRRILSLSGVFSIDVFDCPLRRVARTRIIRSTRERLFRLGTIQIIPTAEDLPDGFWQTIARPKQVHDLVTAAIARTKQG